MTKYDEFLEEPQILTDNSVIFHGSLTGEECVKQAKSSLGIEIDPDNLVVDRIRYGFPPEDVEERDIFDGPCWYTGASGKGSKKVWRLSS
ncbi:MAG: hypothetical protein JSU85_04865 [Candidatus Zixiibacteriota bacterium]|nr:MAG: hypothetical protein JSU85_04865 [candidate division Zixibacteria bacterium]